MDGLRDGRMPAGPSARREPRWWTELAIREFLAAVSKSRRAAARYAADHALRRRAAEELRAAATKLLRRGALELRVDAPVLQWCDRVVWRDSEEVRLAADLASAGVAAVEFDPSGDLDALVAVAESRAAWSACATGAFHASAVNAVPRAV